MKDLTNTLLKFLRTHLTKPGKLLLGLSGGPDSLALFYLLLECQKKVPFTLGIAHVDHGWRPESASEAKQLRKLAEQHSLPFYLKTLQENLRSEEVCREERRTFFQKLAKSHGYQAVVLGHHKGDQAETVLKNLLEGASLPSCNGISEKSTVGTLEIWRPLLNIPKKKLSQWLESKGVIPFDDDTNRDSAYLRARMRIQILPHLEELFGKGIENTLASIGKESLELREFLLSHLADPLASISTKGEKIILDISRYPNLTLFECKFLIRQACRLAACHPSKDIVDDAAKQLLVGQSNKQYAMGNTHLKIDQGVLIIIQK